MANADAPHGLRPVRYLSGAPYNGAVRKYYIPSTDTNAAAYIGSLVKLTGGADANGIPVVTSNVSSGDAVVGVVVSVVPVTADSTTYRANSTSRYVLVADDPTLLFEAQTDGTLAATAAGATCTLTGFTSGDTATGLSAIEIAASGLSETSDTDDDVRIIEAVQSPDNDLTSANSRWLVRLNVHAYVNAGVGV